MKPYDLIIIGAGPAGTLAAKTVASKGMSVLMIERGQDLVRRRDLLNGWFGAGLYRLNRIETKDPLLNNSRAVNEVLKLIRKISGPIKKYKNVCYVPDEVGKDVATYLFHSISSKADVCFNTVAEKINKKNGLYEVRTNKEIYEANRCLISTGSNSMEWINTLCDDLNINAISPSKIKVGVRVEVPAFKTKKIIEKDGDIKIETDLAKANDARPNSFVGEVEPFGGEIEENILSAFSHIIPTKISHKTNFMVGFEMNGQETKEMVRKTQIINVLSNDRIKKERIADYMQDNTILKHFQEFDVLKEAFKEIDKVLPSFISYAIMYVPEICLSGVLPVDENMRVISGIYGAGECTNRVSNVIGAMASGIIAARTILKE